MKQPPTGWTTPCTVVDVYDGDTVVVDVTRRLRIRLLDCWAAEIRGGTQASKAKGQAAKKKLEDFLAGAQAVVLHIPIEDNDAKDWMTMSRVLGRLFADGRDVSVEMVESGQAKSVKK
jgi:endonuclease YncB( thermonuclease family)